MQKHNFGPGLLLLFVALNDVLQLTEAEEAAGKTQESADPTTNLDQATATPDQLNNEAGKASESTPTAGPWWSGPPGCPLPPQTGRPSWSPDETDELVGDRACIVSSDDGKHQTILTRFVNQYTGKSCITFTFLMVDGKHVSLIREYNTVKERDAVFYGANREPAMVRELYEVAFGPKGFG